MARFMDSTPLRSNFPLQSVLTNAFCYLISSMDDYSELVAQRATLYIGTIHDYAMKVRSMAASMCILAGWRVYFLIVFGRFAVVDNVFGNAVRLGNSRSADGAAIVVSITQQFERSKNNDVGFFFEPFRYVVYRGANSFGKNRRRSSL